MKIELMGWCGSNPYYRVTYQDGRAFHAQGNRFARDYIKKAEEIGEDVEINHDELKQFLQQNKK